MYTSQITFLYYKDLQYGRTFFQDVLNLTEVMDQGFAYVYQVTNKGYVGIVKTDIIEEKNKTLVSFTTNNIEGEYKRVKKVEVFNMTSLQTIESIPLTSFFFEDKEGHRFEIQEFLNEEDKNRF